MSKKPHAAGHAGTMAAMRQMKGKVTRLYGALLENGLAQQPEPVLLRLIKIGAAIEQRNLAWLSDLAPGMAVQFQPNSTKRR